MTDERMSYEAWRISFQDSEQAARAAYARVRELEDKHANFQRAALDNREWCAAAEAQLAMLREGCQSLINGWEATVDEPLEMPDYVIRDCARELQSLLTQTAPSVNGEGENSYIDIVFDGPPGPESDRFVEVENAEGFSVRAGSWMQRPDGYWVLRIPRSIQSTIPETLDDIIYKDPPVETPNGI